MGHSNEQLQREVLKPKQAGSLRKVLSTDSSPHGKLDVMGRGQREQSCQIEAVSLGHKEEWHSWSSASNPAQRMGEDLHRLMRVGQGLMRASLILIPGGSRANDQGNRLRPDTERSPLTSTVKSNTNRGNPWWFSDHFAARAQVHPWLSN